MFWNESKRTGNSSTIVTPNSSSTTAIRVTVVTESQFSTVLALACVIWSELKPGNTDEKQTTKRFSISSIAYLLWLLNELWAAFEELSGNCTARHWGPSQQLRKEFAYRAISFRFPEIKADHIGVESVEQFLQARVFDATRKRPATHDPGVDSKLLT